MEFRDALKAMRRELGVTQSELAVALHVSGMTISRWELGKSYPNRSVISLLLGYAYTHAVQKSTIEMLRKTASDASTQKIKNNVYACAVAAEHSSLADFIDNAPFPIFVSDIATDMMLYANKKALELIDYKQADISEYKCYECIMHSDTPCEFCNKARLSEDSFDVYSFKRPTDEKPFKVHGKLIRWNGHQAQIRCVLKSDI